MSKYFNEVPKNSHADIRFYIGPIASEERKKTLCDLLAVLVEICQQYNIKVIIMHGTLIGWHWNQQILPWDDDIDVCLSLEDLEQLDANIDKVTYDRELYLLDINPNYKNRESKNKSYTECKEPNKIDARLISKKNGLFIDITALSMYRNKILRTKCPHYYQYTDIYPLKSASFNEIPIYVPNNHQKVLVQEYGSKSINNPKYRNYQFDYKLKQWVIDTPNKQ